MIEFILALVMATVVILWYVALGKFIAWWILR
jgi:hypothetical protein